MSVLIKGMAMPTNCWGCPFSERRDPDTDRCFITGRSYDATFVRLEFRLDDCPLVPAPPHGDLIEKNAASLTDFEIAVCDGNFEEGMKMLLDKIDNAPIIIEAEEGEE